MFSKKWWNKTLERMTKTGAGALIALIGQDQLGWSSLNWIFIGRTAAIMVLITFLGSILTSNMGPDPDDPSAV